MSHLGAEGAKPGVDALSRESDDDEGGVELPDLKITGTAMQDPVEARRLQEAAERRDPAEITESLYLGSKRVALDAELLRALGITAIVNATDTIYGLHDDIEYTFLNVEDDPDCDLAAHWDGTHDFIAKAIDAGGKVLVHCMAGVSRSSSTVIAYLMQSKLYPTLQEAYDHTLKCKPNIEPNEGFFQQLQALEARLHPELKEPTISMHSYKVIVMTNMGWDPERCDRALNATQDDFDAAVGLILSGRDLPGRR